jgi:hypothetical protein
VVLAATHRNSRSDRGRQEMHAVSSRAPGAGSTPRGSKLTMNASRCAAARSLDPSSLLLPTPSPLPPPLDPCPAPPGPSPSQLLLSELPLLLFLEPPPVPESLCDCDTGGGVRPAPVPAPLPSRWTCGPEYRSQPTQYLPSSSRKFTASQRRSAVGTLLSRSTMSTTCHGTEVKVWGDGSQRASQGSRVAKPRARSHGASEDSNEEGAA